MTLLELLGVLVLFFLLWAFAFPAAEGMVENTRRRRAAADVHSIAAAVVAYRKAYGFVPGTKENAADRTLDDIVFLADGIDVPEASNRLRLLDVERLYEALSPTNRTDNPRRIAFLEMSPGRFRDGRLVDPWGDPYVVVVDADANGWIGIEGGRVGGNVSVSMRSFRIAESRGARRSHDVPALRDSVYVFSWTSTGVQSNRVDSATGGL